jgi:membrane associated rhomboid family serine protease
MLEDRDYMRQPEFGGQRWGPGFRLRWTWTYTLVASYVAVLLAQQAAHKYSHDAIVFNYFALSLEGIEHGYAWQLLTYQFMHANWLHLIFNSWAIIIFGGELERLLGARRFLTLTFASGIVGGALQIFTAWMWPGLFGGAVVGASACAFGLVAAFATLVPDHELTMLILFVIPVRMRARTMLYLFLVIALMGIIFSIGNIAHAAHLGGMAMGWFYVKKILNHPALLDLTEESPRHRPEPARQAAAPEDTDDDGAGVDAILDKISARGINSLTARERAVLEAARKRMARR